MKKQETIFFSFCCLIVVCLVYMCLSMNEIIVLNPRGSLPAAHLLNLLFCTCAIGTVPCVMPARGSNIFSTVSFLNCASKRKD